MANCKLDLTTSVSNWRSGIGSHYRNSICLAICDGVIPKRRLNVAMKCDTLIKPHNDAI